MAKCNQLTALLFEGLNTIRSKTYRLYICIFRLHAGYGNLCRCTCLRRGTIHVGFGQSQRHYYK